MARRRTFLRAGAGLAGGLVLLAGCGFRPMLKAGDDPAVREQLAAIEIAGLGGRLGQLVRNALLEELTPTALEVPDRYRLVVQLNRRASARGIQLNNTITRYNLPLTARFQLLDQTEADILGPSEAMREGLDYFAHGRDADGLLEKLAATAPTTLACMHGSAWSGDGAALLRELGERLRSSR